MSKSEAQRSYPVSDADMLQASRIMHGLFIDDKSSFENFDSLFADPFAANWLQSINNAGDITRDNYFEAELTEKTRIVQVKLEEAKNHYQKLKYFIEKAFPERKEIWKQFGYGDYEDARKSEVKMIQFLMLVYNAASQFKTQLIESGFKESDLEKIKTLQTELSNADLEQEKLKKKRPELTQDRINILNECYKYMQNVSRVGKIIYAGNYAKYNQYLLPNERTEEKKEPEPGVPVN